MKVLENVSVAQVIVAITITVSFLGALWRFWRSVKPFFNRVSNFLEDWNGTIARPGIERRAGVMETIEDIKQEQRRHSVALKELFPNHGSSIKDKMEEVHRLSTENRERLDQFEAHWLPIFKGLVTNLNLKEVATIETKQESKAFLELIKDEKHDHREDY